MQDPEIGEVKTFVHPWGKEEVFADVDGRFVGKVLHVHAGQELGLQLHTGSEVVLSLMSGSVVLELGDDAESLSPLALTPGQTVHIRTGTMHRIAASEDSMLLEVSSPK